MSVVTPTSRCSRLPTLLARIGVQPSSQSPIAPAGSTIWSGWQKLRAGEYGLAALFALSSWCCDAQLEVQTATGLAAYACVLRRLQTGSSPVRASCLAKLAEHASQQRRVRTVKPLHNVQQFFLLCSHRVALRLVATGLATRLMQLLVRHTEMWQTAGHPLPPAGQRANAKQCISLLLAAHQCMYSELEQPDVAYVPAGAAAEASLKEALAQLATAGEALLGRCENMTHQAYPWSQLKALLEREMPLFVEAVAACCSLLQHVEGAATEGGTAGVGSTRPQWPALADPPSEQQLLAVAAALATRLGCGNLCCINCTGADERGMPKGRRCSGCRTVRFCSAACQREAWPQHRVACRLLAAAKPAGG